MTMCFCMLKIPWSFLTNPKISCEKDIGRYFELKEESICSPSLYLGGKMRQFVLDNGANSWAFRYEQYAKAAVNNVEEYLSKKAETLTD